MGVDSAGVSLRRLVQLFVCFLSLSLSFIFIFFFNQEMLPNPFVSLIFLWLPISSISNQKKPIGPIGWTAPSIDVIEFRWRKRRKKEEIDFSFPYIPVSETLLEAHLHLSPPFFFASLL
jgi:hypothetical protein